MPIKYEQLSAAEEFFAWTDHRGRATNITPDGGAIHFAMTRMNAYLAGTAWPVTNIALTDALVMAVVNQNGIELEHLGRISAERLEMTVTLLDSGDGTHIVADGGHRIVARALRGLPYAPAWLVPEKVWRRFTIQGMPGDGHEWRDYLQSQNAPRA